MTCMLAIATSDEEEKQTLKEEWAEYQLTPLPVDIADGLLEHLTKRERDEETGRVKVAAVESRRHWWATFGQQHFPSLAKASSRLLAMHVRTCASERNWSIWGQVYTKGRNRLGLTLGEQIVFIRGNFTGPGDPTDEDVAAQLMEATVEEVVEAADV